MERRELSTLFFLSSLHLFLNLYTSNTSNPLILVLLNLRSLEVSLVFIFTPICILYRGFGLSLATLEWVTLCYPLVLLSSRTIVCLTLLTCVVLPSCNLGTMLFTGPSIHGSMVRVLVLVVRNGIVRHLAVM